MVIVGTPVWNASITPAVRTYLNRYNNRINKVAFFVTFYGRGIEKVMKEMRNVSKMKPVTTMDIKEREIKKDDYEGKIFQFMNKIKDLF